MEKGAYRERVRERERGRNSGKDNGYQRKRKRACISERREKSEFVREGFLIGERMREKESDTHTEREREREGG